MIGDEYLNVSCECRSFLLIPNGMNSVCLVCMQQTYSDFVNFTRIGKENIYVDDQFQTRSQLFLLHQGKKITQINRLICYLTIPNKSIALDKLISLEAMVFNQNDVCVSQSNITRLLLFLMLLLNRPVSLFTHTNQQQNVCMHIMAWFVLTPYANDRKLNHVSIRTVKIHIEFEIERIHHVTPYVLAARV